MALKYINEQLLEHQRSYLRHWYITWRLAADRNEELVARAQSRWDPARLRAAFGHWSGLCPRCHHNHARLAPQQRDSRVAMMEQKRLGASPDSDAKGCES
jgi:hypothetical protein